MDQTFSMALLNIYARRYNIADVVDKLPAIHLQREVSPPSPHLPDQHDLDCPICLGFPTDPVSLSTCGHITCGRCVMRNMDVFDETQRRLLLHGGLAPNAYRCVTCRGVFFRADITPLSKWPLFAQQLWKSYVSKCRYCGFHSEAGALLTHENEQCGSRPVQCPVLGCDVKATASAMHMHVPECGKLTVYCIDCGLPCRFVNLHQHNCITALRQYVRALRTTPPVAAEYFKPGPKGKICNQALPGELFNLPEDSDDDDMATDPYTIDIIYRADATTPPPMSPPTEAPFAPSHQSSTRTSTSAATAPSSPLGEVTLATMGRGSAARRAPHARAIRRVSGRRNLFDLN